ncbi:hypothetical protein HMPREF1568_2005 [Providencia alcalifaciens PAL-3]|nr:hypothetical protein HMPREF1568_2005 [Providencia alcalifaciens PAL-3]EUC98028.1 hypothetical protein HMPREF1566_1195 [Providencia alcalifaciens PAL-1]
MQKNTPSCSALTGYLLSIYLVNQQLQCEYTDDCDNANDC